MSKLVIDNFKKFKLVTIDITNTLLYFKKPPEIVYLDYAVKSGLSADQFDKNLMKINFRKNFKSLSKTYPNFGCQTIGYEKWWEELVIGVFQDSSSSSEIVDKFKLEETARKLINAYATDECWGKFHKSEELINDLRSAGKIVGVISNFDPRLHKLLTNVGLPKFDFVITSYECKYEKPKKEIFDAAVDASKICKPHEAIHIGNEDKDFNGAKNAGWSAIMVNSDDTSAKSQHKFKDIQEFYNAITRKHLQF